MKTHLKIIAQSNSISKDRISEVLEIVGLSDKGNAKLGTLSLGEGQRLGLAAALLGDPQYLVLDEPTNGLDPTGIRWFRKFIRQQSDMGKTVLLSSHILSEVEAVADDVVIINHGKIITTGEIKDVMKDLESLEDVFFLLLRVGLNMNSFLRSVRFELNKISSMKMWWIICLIAIVAQPLLALITARGYLKIGLDATPETQSGLLNSLPPLDYFGFELVPFGLLPMVIFGGIIGGVNIYIINCVQHYFVRVVELRCFVRKY